MQFNQMKVFCRGLSQTWAVPILMVAYFLWLGSSETVLANDENPVVGVRSPNVEMFRSLGDSSAALTVSRREARSFVDQPLEVLKTSDGWLQVLHHDGNAYWVEAKYMRRDDNRPKVSCGRQLGASIVGASRGLGESCAD